MTRRDDSSTFTGLAALLGHVVVKIDRCDARFDVDGKALTHPRELFAPGGTIGRQDGDTVKLVGPDAEGVSRHHLAIRPVGHVWTLFDAGSRNSTYELAAEDGVTRWVPLVPWQAVPLGAEMRLSLGKRMRLVLRVEHVPLTGTTTPSEDRPIRVWEVRVPPGKLERLAFALLAPRRDDDRADTVPTVAELSGALSFSPSELYRQRKQLQELPPVAALLHGNGWRDLAAALAPAYPYLLFRAASNRD